ncbi:hypothetical protein Tco_1038577 [Tanacetum coccineum]
MAKSLVSHISSKGKSQSGAIKIGASITSILQKRSGFIQKQSTKEEEETVQKEDVISEQVVKESSRKA